MPLVLALLRSFDNNRSVILNSANINFKLVTTLLSHTVPEVYFVNNGTEKDGASVKLGDIVEIAELVERLFANLTGINSLVNHIVMLLRGGPEQQNIGSSNSDSMIQSMTNILCKVLFPSIADASVVYNLLTNYDSIKQPLQLRRNLLMIDTLFFNSKIFHVVSGCYNERKSQFLDIDPHLLSKVLDISEYTVWANIQFCHLVDRLAEVKLLDFSGAMFNLVRIKANNYKILLDKLLIEPMLEGNNQMLDGTFAFFDKFSLIKKTLFVLKFLIKYLYSLLDDLKITRINYTKVVGLLSFFLTKFQFCRLDYQHIILELLKNNSSSKLSTVTLLHAIVYNQHLNLRAHFNNLFRDLIKDYWGNEFFVKNQSIKFQELFTLFLLICLNHIQNQDFLQSLLADQYMLSSVTYHLDQPVTKVRFLGIILAEGISRKIQLPPGQQTTKTLDFNMKDSKAFEKELVRIKLQDNVISNITELVELTERQDIAGFESNMIKLKKFITTDFKSQYNSQPKTIPTQQNQAKLPSLAKETSTDLIELNRYKISLLNLTNDSGSESGSDSDDEDHHDPTLAKQNNSMPATPVYFKDLFAYLNSSSKEEPYQSFLKRRIALENFSKLVRLKRNFVDEIEYWSERLCGTLLNLKIDSVVAETDKQQLGAGNENGNREDNQEEDQANYYNQLKLLGLISLITVRSSTVPKYLVKQLLTGDYSLQERLLIVNSIGLAARELRGYKDEINYKNLKIEKNFTVRNQIAGKVWPGKKLQNNELHSRFLVLDENHYPQEVPQKKGLAGGNSPLEIERRRLDSINTNIGKSINKNSKELISDKLINTDQGKIIKISSRLLKERERKANGGLANSGSNKNGSYDSTDKYSANCYEDFISPFLAIWLNLDNDIHSLGQYTSIFVVNYLKNLSVLVHCAFPAAPNLMTIIGEVFEILDSLKKFNSGLVSEPLVGGGNSDSVALSEISNLLECQLYLLLGILQLASHSLLVSMFQDQVVGFFSWLNYLFDNFENIFGQDVVFQNNKSLVANCLLQITEILNSQIGDLGLK